MPDSQFPLGERPQRWDQPYGEMTAEDVDTLLKRPEFAAIDTKRFPDSLQLADLLKYDCRIRTLAPGDLMIREGDYGNSAFFILEGVVRVVIRPALPAKILGRSSEEKRSFFTSMAQLWQNSKLPEVRNRYRSTATPLSADIDTVNLHDAAGAAKVFTGPLNETTGLRELSSDYQAITLAVGRMVGEIAALGRVQRTATVFADVPSRVLEMRWQGLREIRKFDPIWRHNIDESYRENMLRSMLATSPYFSKLGNSTRDKIAQSIQFETYGGFEWGQEFKGQEHHDGSTRAIGSKSEPIVAEEGHYANGALLIGAGFARVSKRMGNGKRTLKYLRAGDIFGFDELFRGWKEGAEMRLDTTLSAIGYIHVLRIPLLILKKHVFPNQEPSPSKVSKERSLVSDSLLEWAVDQRFINGTKVMLINQDHCVRCDDCVRACAATHDNNPRFLRHGKQHGHWLVTNACMHCTDPVCMIGCPTGAIHRTLAGVVVINDATCIGCATCANACPYHNIRMVEINDRKGRPIVDSATGNALLKATKCDLCSTQSGGPACVRACPHDALQRIDFHEDILPTRTGLK